jgi:hypothetical protein
VVSRLVRTLPSIRFEPVFISHSLTKTGSTNTMPRCQLVNTSDVDAEKLYNLGPSGEIGAMIGARIMLLPVAQKPRRANRCPWITTAGGNADRRWFLGSGVSAGSQARIWMVRRPGPRTCGGWERRSRG